MVFPAYAGMSRHCSDSELLSVSFPRLRGDEPGPQNAAQRIDRFSPPTRG